MAVFLHVKTIAMLALICLPLTQCLVIGHLHANNLNVSGSLHVGDEVDISVSNTDRSVAIRVRNDETSSAMINVTFPVNTFRSFYGTMCKSSPAVEAWYATNGTLDDKPVAAINYMTSPDNFLGVSSVYQCQNNPSDPAPPSLDCVRLDDTSGLSGKCVKAQSFRLDDEECQTKCVTLVWFYEDDSITFNTRNMSDLQICDAAVTCLSATQKPPQTTTTTTTTTNTTPTTTTTTTRRPVTSTRSSTVTASPFASSTTTNNNSGNDDNTTIVGIIPDKGDDADDNTVVIIGVIVAAAAIVIIVVIAVVWWKRRKKQQGNKKPENHYVISPTSFGANDASSSADPSSNVNSRPIESSQTALGGQHSNTSASASQAADSSLEIQDSIRDEHAYATLSTDPYYSTIKGITTNSTNVKTSGISKYRSRPGNFNALDSNPNCPSTSSGTSNVSSNSVPVYTFIPSCSSSDGSYAYPKDSTTSAGNPSTRRNSYISIIGEPTTAGVYSEADIVNSTVRGNRSENRAGNSNTRRNSYISIIGEPTAGGVHSEPDDADSAVGKNRSGVSAVNPSTRRNSYISIIGEPTAGGVYSEPDDANSTVRGNHAGNSSTRRNSYISIIGEPTAGGVYSEPDDANSTVTRGGTGALTENTRTQRNSYITIIGEPGIEGVYSDADVAYSTVTGDYVNRNATANRVTGWKV